MMLRPSGENRLIGFKSGDNNRKALISKNLKRLKQNKKSNRKNENEKKNGFCQTDTSN
jgi:hypothetical protein